jgi:hypothetical protein
MNKFTTFKFDWDRIRIGLAHWIRTWIHIEIKSWIRIRIETNADPQHWLGQQKRVELPPR